ncbi:MAG TPA: radical SAM protein [bacterium]|nr:radical SAM protein [bacterium]
MQPTYYQDAQKTDVYNIVPPLSLAYLAAIAKKSGHSVKIFDVMGREKKINDILNKFNPDIIGITCLTTYYPEFYKLVNFIKKELNYKGLIICGGPHITLEPEKTIKQTEADIAVIGEAEESFKELLLEIANNGDYTKVSGLYIKNFGYTKRRTNYTNLDEILIPAYEELELDKYVTNTVFVECSRGCPYNCIYCSSKFLYGNLLRWQKPEKVIEIIKLLKEKFNYKEFSPLADTFVCNIKWLEKFVKLLDENKINMPFRCNGRINLMNDKVFELLKKAGCYEIDYGIESADERILKNMNKAIKEEDLEKVIKMTYEYGFKTHLYFMLSLPGETEKDMDKTINFSKEMKEKYNCTTEFQITRIYPGTPLAEKTKLEIDDWSIEREPELPYPNVPAYYEIDKKIVYSKWRLACENIRDTSLIESLKVIPDLYKTSRNKKLFFYQLFKRGVRKINNTIFRKTIK